MASKFLVMRVHPDAKYPKKGSEYAAGYDVCACEPMIVMAGKHAMIRTGLKWACPANTYARIAPRSGLALKNQINVGAGVIDEDYRGEVQVILFNHGPKDFQVKVGDRIAQVIIEKIEPTEMIPVEELEETVRGAGGFGSTGVSEKLQEKNQ